MATSSKFKGDPGPKTPAGKRWKNKGIPRERRGADMNVTAYDKVSAFLSSTLLLVGSLTALLFLIWLGNQIVIRPAVVPVNYLPEELGGGGSGNGQEAMSQELEEPSPEELQLVEPNLTQTLEVLTDVVSTNAVDLESLEAAASGFGKGVGTGRGDGRGPGPGGVGTGTMLPDWEVRFQGTTLESYASQLDFFGIELAVVGGGKATVDYASQLTLKKPVARSSDGKDERRRYLLWRKGPLAEADRTLLSRAGIDHGGRVILQFVPPPVEQQMKLLEAQWAKGRRLAEIKKTIFAVEGSPGNYKFVVVDQIYRF